MTIKIKKDGSMEIDAGAIISQMIHACADIAKSNGGRIVKIDYSPLKAVEHLEEAANAILSSSDN